MRPPDENQHGSTRPNLLSGARRRFGGDDNILERLERDSARHASGNRSRAAWYAAAASLVLLVIVVAGWMAYESASTVRVVPMTRVPADGNAAQTTLAPEETAPRPATLAPPGATAMPAPVPAQREALPEPARNDTVASVPPLVLLPAQQEPAQKPASAARSAASAVAGPITGPVAIPAGAASRRPAASVRTARVAQPQAAPARAAPRATAAVARSRKPVIASAASDPIVDRDVALLSAIIIHDSAHADEKAQLEAAAACMRASTRKCHGDGLTESSLNRWSR